MSDLAGRQCVPCRGGVPPLGVAERESLLGQLDGWEVIAGHHLRKIFEFADFRGALSFVNRVGELAETQGHHPDISFGWGRAELNIWTHKIDGLTESDFILAAKIDAQEAGEKQETEVRSQEKQESGVRSQESE